MALQEAASGESLTNYALHLVAEHERVGEKGVQAFENVGTRSTHPDETGLHAYPAFVTHRVFPVLRGERVGHLTEQRFQRRFLVMTQVRCGPIAFFPEKTRSDLGSKCFL